MIIIWKSVDISLILAAEQRAICLEFEQKIILCGSHMLDDEGVETNSFLNFGLARFAEALFENGIYHKKGTTRQK